MLHKSVKRGERMIIHSSIHMYAGEMAQINEILKYSHFTVTKKIRCEIHEIIISSLNKIAHTQHNKIIKSIRIGNF